MDLSSVRYKGFIIAIEPHNKNYTWPQNGYSVSIKKTTTNNNSAIFITGSEFASNLVVAIKIGEKMVDANRKWRFQEKSGPAILYIKRKGRRSWIWSVRVSGYIENSKHVSFSKKDVLEEGITALHRIKMEKFDCK